MWSAPVFFRVAFAQSLSTLCTAAGIRPAMAGNFSLSRQRKVTKREALSSERPCALEARARPEATRCALAAVPVTDTMHRNFMPLNARLHAVLTNEGTTCADASPQRRLVFGICTREHGVQPRVRRRDGGWMPLVTGTAARAQRVASSQKPSDRFRARFVAASRRLAVQRLFFGDFLLAPQKKVTPPPGGTPGTLPPDKRR